MFKRSVWIVAVILLSTLLFAITTAQYKTQINVLIWTEFAKYISDYLPEFEKSTGIKVNLEAAITPDLPKLTKANISSEKSKYDLVTIDEPFIPEFAELLVPFDKWPNGKLYKKPDPKIFAPNAFEASFWNKVFSGMPFNVNIYIWITRKDLLKNPNYAAEFKQKYGYELSVTKTFKELRDTAEFFYNKGIYGFAPFTNINFQGTTAEAIFMFESFGTSPLTVINGKVKVTLDTKIAEEAITFYKELLKFAPPNKMEMAHDERIKVFNEGKVFTMFQWPLFVPQHEDPKTSKVAGNIIYSVPPIGPTKRAAIRGCWVLALPKASKNKEAAAEFAYWLVSKDVQSKLIPKGLIPVRADLLLNPEINKDRPWFRTVFESSRNAVARPRFPGYLEASKIIRENWYAGISGKISSKEAAERMKKELLDLVEKYEKRK
ncbi:extracellular solute-binding protein [Fervidobacterium sp.]